MSIVIEKRFIKTGAWLYTEVRRGQWIKKRERDVRSARNVVLEKYAENQSDWEENKRRQ